MKNIQKEQIKLKGDSVGVYLKGDVLAALLEAAGDNRSEWIRDAVVGRLQDEGFLGDSDDETSLLNEVYAAKESGIDVRALIREAARAKALEAVAS